MKEIFGQRLASGPPPSTLDPALAQVKIRPKDGSGCRDLAARHTEFYLRAAVFGRRSGHLRSYKRILTDNNLLRGSHTGGQNRANARTRSPGQLIRQHQGTRSIATGKRMAKRESPGSSEYQKQGRPNAYMAEPKPSRASVGSLFSATFNKTTTPGHGPAGQSAGILCQSGPNLLLSYNPLYTRPVQLPSAGSRLCHPASTHYAAAAQSIPTLTGLPSPNVGL